MNFCTSHWEKLKEAVTKHELFHLVAKSGEELAGKMKKEIDEKFVVPDPLMTACMMLTSRALEIGGNYLLLSLDENGKAFCPMCELNKNADMKEAPLPKGFTTVSDFWMDSCVEAIKKDFIKKGYLNRDN